MRRLSIMNTGGEVQEEIEKATQKGKIWITSRGFSMYKTCESPHASTEGKKQSYLFQMR